MKTHRHSLFIPLLLLVCIASLLGGCQTRSISDSDYHEDRYDGHNPHYKGELSEYDVLGVERGATVSDEQIAKALEGASLMNLPKASSLLVIQSGAYLPDEAMRVELAKDFRVVPFSGQPGEGKGESLSKALRLAAAQAGCEHVLCYWGTLESTREGLGTKTVSWVPVAGWVLPDETQRTRLRVKAALIDTRSGQWAILVPEPVEGKVMSGRLNRASADQTQVEKLKRQGYAAVVSEITKLGAN